ncbi:unnamed protein product [Adineta steineri]|uniref:histone acetyltransferase n=1 Tax=Adineta steineri TaxID=433720 RepID=A0A814I1U0_9BILA|nr:unnamed protein product [Adineta steineri]CAF1017667.1 unnamed protein product [Adineta steineri]
MVAKGARDRCSSSSTNATNTSTTTKQRRVSSTSHDKKKIAKPIGICGFCLGDNLKNANGIPEEMIHCAECGNSGHPSCLQYSEKLVEKIRTIRWQCIDCKRCIICNKSDDSLLFCDFCDSGIHPKCCNPPLNTIPKGDFACHLCHDEIELSPKKSLSLSPTRSLRNNHSNNDNTSPIIAQHNDNVSNFFLPTNHKKNHIRQQSVQKAMKYLRDKKTLTSSKKKLLKRLHSPILDVKSSKENKDDLLTKTQRIKRKFSNENLSSSPQTSTPLLTRQLSNKKLLTIEPITPPHRVSRRSDNHSIEELNKTNSSRSITKRTHSTNSMSPISTTSSTINKRIRKDSSTLKNKKRKESQTEDELLDNDKHKITLNLSKYKNPPGFLNDPLPENITEHDVYLFLESRANSAKLITDCSEKFHHSSECIDDNATNTRWPPYIVFGSDLLKTWYSSSYPQEYARVPRLYICEFCLKYMKCEQVYDRHRKTCTAFHPPANEIYHKDDLSVFEVDGNINRYYCQNLCLLAKSFLDHKTLYYDVEPFLFYVLTKNDAYGCHFVGYFSKEKHCPQKYNLSCITVLPNCQRRGYGRFLIELSYLISQKEGQFGTPERPLSTLGAQTYEAYWKIKIIEQLLIYYNENNTKCLLKTIMNETGMAVDDIIDTLQNLGVLTMKSNKKPAITVDVTQLETMIKTEKIRHAHWVSVDSEYLRFTPVLTHLLLTNEEKAVEKQVKEIQIVFKEIGREAAEAASLSTELADGSNLNEGVRYIRRRKFGHKRRSLIVKRRTPVSKKSTKNDSMITHNDSCAMDVITNGGDDEHSQEYKPRRPKPIINESIKEEIEEQEEENKNIDPVISPPKIPIKQTTLKQLKLDQFLKVVQPPTIDSFNDVKSESNHVLPSDLETKNDDDNDDIHLQTRRITRNTRLHSTSETDLIKNENTTSSETSNQSDLNQPKLLVREVSDEGLSNGSSHDGSTTTEASFSSSILNMDQPSSERKQALPTSDVQSSIDDTISPSKTKLDQPILNHEISVATTNASETPSSLSDILANPFRSTSPSINGTDDERKIACIESQLKTDTIDTINNNNQEVEEDEQDSASPINQFETTIKPIEASSDEAPPSLTSPTSMVISQSNHYNYSARSKQQLPQPQQQSITINNFNTSTNMTYNFNNPSYVYPYPPAPAYGMQPYYYPSPTSMDYLPYYPAPSSSVYPSTDSVYNTSSEHQSFYATNGMNTISYNSNGTPSYNYPTAPPTSTTSASQQH